MADNSRSVIHASPVPAPCRGEPCCLGVDEAGRGPVLGPMVYGICYCPVSQKQRLASLGFADSKTLDEAQRDALFRVIRDAGDFIGWAVKVLSPQDISASMLRRSKYNLNALSHDTAIELIQGALDAGAYIKEVYVDTVGDPARYQEKLSGLFPDIAITVTAKADSLFPVVSAASICAKVTRDDVLKNWVFAEADLNISANYGCGYPSDPTTQQWLKDVLDPVFGYPGIVRFSWATCKNLLDKHAVPVRWEDDDEDDANAEAAKGTPAISSFFGAARTAERHRFFSERKLRRVADM